MASYTIKATAEGKQLERILKEISTKTVKVGFQDGWATEDDGTDICDIATWNEFGTDKIPSRPFMRDSVDNHINELDGLFEREVVNIQRGIPAKRVLDEIGIFVKDLIQTEIKNGDFEPNAPYTIAKKGSTRPLIDTGRMRQSVNYIITDRS